MVQSNIIEQDRWAVSELPRGFIYVIILISSLLPGISKRLESPKKGRIGK